MTPLKLPILLSCLLLSITLSAQKATVLPDWDTEPQELARLNSEYRDVNLSLTPNGRYLYFMSGRGGMPWSNMSYTTFRGRAEGDGDVWFSRRADGQWAPPQCIGQPVCTHMGEDEPNISADGQSVYFQSWRPDWRETGGPYYRAELHGDAWGKPEGLGGGIGQFFRSNQYATDGMSVSPDGKTFVVAAGPDYDGRMDLFVSRKQAGGAWSFPEKLDVSTPADERSAFIGADNKTLYFGSAGWGGFGGLDIFKTTLEGGTACGEVINIGRPFNTKEEDYGFVIDAVRNDVYFVRNSDIFYAHLGAGADERIRPEPVVVIDGTVKDSSGRAVEARINLVFNETSETVAQARSNALTGEYSLSFARREGPYTQQIEFNDHFTLEQELVVGENTETLVELPVVADPVRLQPKAPEPGPEKKKAQEYESRYVVYFDFDHSGLDETAKAELRQLKEALAGAQSYRIALAGHTDSIGPEDYNQGLSERRNRAVLDFLAALGVDASIEATAMGEKQPAAANDTPENRAKNRRVEVEVRIVR